MCFLVLQGSVVLFRITGKHQQHVATAIQGCTRGSQYAGKGLTGVALYFADHGDRVAHREAATKAALLRFRPVMMTSLSFVVGVFPLVIASGAGAASRVSLGMAVFGGTIMAAITGTLLVPVFFTMVQGIREKVHGGRTPPPE